MYFRKNTQRRLGRLNTMGVLLTVSLLGLVRPGLAAPPPPPSPADPAIAYVSSSQLKVMNADGSNATAIYTATGYLGLGPSWSPDGTQIAFPTDFNLWRIDVSVVNGVPTGTNATLLLDRSTSLYYPAWSPLGDEIAFVDSDGATLDTLEVIPAAGGTSVVLYSSTVVISYPTWSPTADRIAFLENDGIGKAIKVLDLAFSTVTVVLDGSFSNQFSSPVGHLDWARTGDVLAFSVGAVNGGDTAVYSLDLAGGLPVLEVSTAQFPTWSPDDSKLCYSNGKKDRKLKIIDLATGSVTTFSTTSGSYWPDWRRF